MTKKEVRKVICRKRFHDFTFHADDGGLDTSRDAYEGYNASNIFTVNLITEMAVRYVATGKNEYVPGNDFSDYEFHVWENICEIVRNNAVFTH